VQERSYWSEQKLEGDLETLLGFDPGPGYWATMAKMRQIQLEKLRKRQKEILAKNR
jgi:hypothetical protein